MKYESSKSEGEILTNLLGLKTVQQIGLAEFEGFLKAEIQLTESLTEQTRFDSRYICEIHRLALEHLYEFAGKYRTVNLSKGGFTFAAAKFLSESMATFDQEILMKLSDSYTDNSELIRDIAMVHGEFLFIHPFREGNGRTARVLANLMARKAGYEPLQFNKVGDDEFKMYVEAVQKSAEKDYSKIIKFIELIFPE